MLAEPPNAAKPVSASAEAEGFVLKMEVDGRDLAAMRQRVRAALAELDQDLVQDVELVCTELAANACDHAAGPHHLVLRHGTRDGLPSVLVEVRDATPDRFPQVGMSTLGPHRGHGLKMVQSLAAAWGVHGDTTTKTVWAVVTTP
ncbi:anti-sigma regulatory factor (Ser/Thr protein kinase) [Saccharothrix coeruleofusca]|uniref:ATP-binding protein n=1 Tax=Saccharothrix coeruleofusca TaxID=33919 RepID=UPI001AE590E4|nr:ATP-binding protein [Saccharothrix coeruleofusca]MBP2333951.1 anti-sigma regulatory factor (Ser/Thr protein kinase) [Saccharothrix coeruleofusca]